MFSYYKKRVLDLGLKGIKRTLVSRIHKKIFAFLWKKKTIKNEDYRSWKELSKVYNIPSNFNIFFQQLKVANQSRLNNIIQSTKFKTLLPKRYITQANSIVKGSFNIFGSWTKLDLKNIPWQQDFKIIHKIASKKFHSIYTDYLTKKSSLFFYQDIKIQSPNSIKFDEYASDIKVPWELSRMQHLLPLGKSYQITKQKDYIHTFMLSINSWIQHNPFLLGVNWVCPMEVSIRVINIIWGYSFFVAAPSIPQSFWQKVICSLFAHTLYLENNWETSDKPNNHYLADLIGYLYLCCFFNHIPYFEKQKKWVYNIILEQLKIQISVDGTSYEGSTAYHKLDTEIFIHFIELCKNYNIICPSWAKKKISSMILFTKNCSDFKGNFVYIGDDDSGKIVTGIKTINIPNHNSTNGLTKTESKIITYKNFGLTIIKQSNWHITFRHPTFVNHQPTGHFHNDQLAITISINGHPILVDPGSYLYTANSSWRNFFRSEENHNTFFAKNLSNIQQKDLFQLHLVPQNFTGNITNSQSIFKIHDYHKKYQKTGFISHRKIIFNRIKKKLIIEDWIESNTEQNIIEKPLTIHSWTFLLAPKINVKQINPFTWKIYIHQKPVVSIFSTLALTIKEGFYSPVYGCCKKTIKLSALQELTIWKKQITTIIQH
jgi:hypothetical protein